MVCKVHTLWFEYINSTQEPILKEPFAVRLVPAHISTTAQLITFTALQSTL